MLLGGLKFQVDINEYLPKEMDVKDEIIGDYLSESGKPVIEDVRKRIKMKHLVSHTAGFDEKSVVGLKYRNDLRMDLMKNMPPRIRYPEEISSYNNYAVCLLAYILQYKEKIEYSELLKKKIFIPLEMTNGTYYTYNEAKNDKRFVKMEYRKNNKNYEWPINIQDTNCKPCGAIYTNHLDMQKYMKFLLNKGKPLLTEEEFDELFKTRYSISDNFPGIDVLFYDHPIIDVLFKGHDGDLSPFHSTLMFNFENDFGIFITMSSGNSKIREVIMNKFVERFFQEENYCEKEYNGVTLKDGQCGVSLVLASKWRRKRDHKSVEEYKNEYSIFEGCYVSTRHEHTTFMKYFFYYSIFNNKDDKNLICIQLNHNYYLSFKIGNDEYLILENRINLLPYSGSFIFVKDIGNGNAMYELNQSSSMEFVYVTADKKYWVFGPKVFHSFEYIGDLKYPNWLRKSIDFIYLFLNFGVFSLIIIFVFVFLCNCSLNICCCIKRDSVFQRRREYRHLMDEERNSSISINSEYEEDEDGVIEKEKEKDMRYCLLIYYITHYCGVIFISISAILNTLHYYLVIVHSDVFLENRQYYREEEYSKNSSSIPIFSIIFLVVGSILLVLNVISSFTSFNMRICWIKKKTVVVRKYFFRTQMIIVVIISCILLLANILYYKFCAFYNIF